MPDASRQPPAPLAPEDAARLVEFARAFRAAARAVSMYPAAHPSIADTLRRVVEITSSGSLHAPLRITVLPEGLLLDDRATARPDQAVAELAELLHHHLVWEVTVHPDGSVDAWRALLHLLGRAPEQLRAEGGIVRTWAAAGGRHVELREIDYTEVLREHVGGEAAGWERVIASCLEGPAGPLNDDDARALVDVAKDATRLSGLVHELEARTQHTTSDSGIQSTALLGLLRRTVAAVERYQPEDLEPVLHNMANAVGQLSPDALIGLLSEGSGERDEERDLTGAVTRRMSDNTIAQFVARNVMASTPTERTAEAFQSLVSETDDRRRVLGLAHDEVAGSPLGSTDGFDGAWQQIAESLLGSATNQTPDYERELSGARTRAISVEHAGGDPPERIGAWLTTVEASALRALDLALVLDLLRIETANDRWDELMGPVVALLEDFLLVGDFDAACAIVEVLVREAATGVSTGRRQSAVTAIDLLVAGPMMRSVVTHLATMDDGQFAHVRTMCVSLGEILVKPLAEALSNETSDRSRDRLTAIVLAFGAMGRRTVERLKGSPNVAVRRAAIYLLREFGGDEALPDLTELLNDTEPQVQREAVRAILNIGTERAYQIVEQALATGTALSRDAIMQAMVGVRRERAAPLFAHILQHTDHRGPLAPVYLRAIESLGMLRDPIGIKPLDEALHRGEWWAPRRSALLRAAAAAALARIGTPDAQAVLEGAAATGTRGVRSAARQHLPIGAHAHTGQEKGSS